MIAPRYPRPAHETIIEPFAGSACYSLCYPDRRVLLFDRDPVIVGVWQYLIHATEDEILSLPDVPRGADVREIMPASPAQDLVGFWINQGAATPRFTATKWSSWGARMRERIASQLHAIRHWQVHQCSYDEIPNYRATWFVDPPYQDKGRYYRYGSSQIDYAHLAEWCLSRSGQKIVCENEVATWLPFAPFTIARSQKKGRKSKEVIYEEAD